MPKIARRFHRTALQKQEKTLKRTNTKPQPQPSQYHDNSDDSDDDNNGEDTENTKLSSIQKHQTKQARRAQKKLEWLQMLARKAVPSIQKKKAVKEPKTKTQKDTFVPLSISPTDFANAMAAVSIQKDNAETKERPKQAIKSRGKKIAREKVQFKKILQTTGFKKNPLAAIKAHLQAVKDKEDTKA